MWLVEHLFYRTQNRRPLQSLPPAVRRRMRQASLELAEEERRLSVDLELEVLLRLALVDEETTAIVASEERDALEAQVEEAGAIRHDYPDRAR